jgi:DNA invertase Pin-like site-specific DNA recombinase
MEFGIQERYKLFGRLIMKSSNSPTTNIPGAAYVRRGANPAPNEFTLDTQLERIKACAMQDGVEIVTVYSDQVNGTGKKPGIEKLMLDAQNGRFRTLYVYALRQLSAQREVALEITDRLQVLGIEVKVVDQDAAFVVKEPKMMLKKAAA